MYEGQHLPNMERAEGPTPSLLLRPVVALLIMLIRETAMGRKIANKLYPIPRTDKLPVTASNCSELLISLAL